MTHGLAPQEWLQVREAVARSMGLHFPCQRLPELQQAVAAVAQELDPPDAEFLARQLLAAPPGRSTIQRLARHLTVGETYFFRDSWLMEALAQVVLPPLLRARRHGPRRLRIWSAACSSGEEPYSVAILLLQLVPDLAKWDIRICATDINPAALEKAAAGVYGKWSFRGTSPGLKQAWFERRADGRHAIAKRVRDLVDFGYMNLAEDNWPSWTAQGWDLVLCRNVLMYFAPQQIKHVVGRLHACLADGGWLFVSPSEASQTLFNSFTTVSLPGVTGYRRGNALANAVFSPGCSRGDSPPPTPAAIADRGREATARPRPRSISGYDQLSQRARAHADQGSHLQALKVCTDWLTRDRLDPGAHYVHAAILIEMGEWAQARASLRSAVFIDPDFVLAHVALGELARREDRHGEAGRHFDNARQLLARMQPGDLLREGDGLSAGALGALLSRGAA